MVLDRMGWEIVFVIWPERPQLFIDHLVQEVSTASAAQNTSPVSHAPFTAVTVVNDGRAFVGTPLLHLGIPDADLPALWTLGVGVDTLRLDLVPLDGLDN